MVLVRRSGWCYGDRAGHRRLLNARRWALVRPKWRVGWRCLGPALGLLWVFALLLLLQMPAAAANGTVLVTRVSGTITPVVADHLVDGVERAEREGHVAYLVELDTPGGLDTSMRQIVQAFLDARVPVMVYVSPAGARAASAGSIITSSAHVAAMSPGTTIGAATPINAETGETASPKVINDAEAVAAERGRNTEFAVDTVREGRSVAAAEALEIGAVDLIAASRSELLAAADGRRVVLGDGNSVVVRTGNAATVEHQLGLLRSVLQALADPNLAFLFLSIGTLALIYELATPGMGLGGVIGVIMLVLGFFALSVLPVNIAGLLLLGLASGLFVAEVFAPGIGVFAGGGVIALLFAGLFLFQDGQAQVDPVVLWPTAVLIGIGVVIAGRLAWRARSTQPISGSAAFAGREAVLRDASGRSGRTWFEGAWWAVSSEDELSSGQRVRVVGIDGLTLIVQPIDMEGEAT
jgi:membrane-bound serine protease (ClpP class)